MNADLPDYLRASALDRQAWLFAFMRDLDGSNLSERERKACWTWAERWSLCMSAAPAERAPRYPYEWVLRQVRHPAFGGCR